MVIVPPVSPLFVAIDETEALEVLHVPDPVMAPVPFPVRQPVRVVAPVPPFPTMSVPPIVRVPDVVIAPPVRVRPVVPPEPDTDVTVPPEFVSTMHTPFTATQPPYGRLMPAIVLVAVVDAYVEDIGPARVEEAVDVPMRYPTVNDGVPVAVRRVPLYWRRRPFVIAVVSRPMVPVVVMVPPVSPAFVPTDETVAFDTLQVGQVTAFVPPVYTSGDVNVVVAESCFENEAAEIQPACDADAVEQVIDPPDPTCMNEPPSGAVGVRVDVAIWPIVFTPVA